MRALRAAFPAAAAIAALALIVLVPGSSTQTLIGLVLIYATIGLGWNILGGIAGQSSFGHALFVGIGAFTVAILQSVWGISPLLGVIPAMIIAAVAALLIGWPTFRLSGVYFSLATLAYPLMMIPVMSWLGFQEVTVPYRPEGGEWYLQFTDPRWLTIICLAVTIIAAVTNWLILRSRFGTALMAIREDQVAAETAGINVLRGKLIAYVISAVLTAIAGALYASLLYVVTPESVFGLLVSVLALIIPLVGGRGTVWGPILGAAVLVTLSHQLSAAFGATLPGVNGLMFGAAIVLTVAFAREGVLWRVRDAISTCRQWRPVTHERLESMLERPAARALTPVPAGHDIVLAVSGVRKAFRANKVLTDVSLTVRRGEIVGVIGPNGAGKTTLLNIINGNLPSDGGTVMVDGRDITGRPPHVIARAGVARTFQVARLLPRASVSENVAISTLSASDGAERTRNAIEFSGLSPRSDQPAGDLDVGQVRRLELARAVASGPRLILVDEILAGLSAGQVAVLLDDLRVIAASGVGVLIIEHTIGALSELADRLVMLDHGRLVAEGPPEEVLADERVVEAYLGASWSKHA